MADAASQGQTSAASKEPVSVFPDARRMIASMAAWDATIVPSSKRTPCIGVSASFNGLVVCRMIVPSFRAVWRRPMPPDHVIRGFGVS
jgi:hypothetical protein